MNSDWRLQYGYPALARLPGTLPWRLAPRLGRDPAAARVATEDFLTMRFGQVFPEADERQRRQWATAHMDMVALELMDAAAVPRVGSTNGPSITLTGWEHAQALAERGKGFLVVLTHFAQTPLFGWGNQPAHRDRASGPIRRCSALACNHLFAGAGSAFRGR